MKTERRHELETNQLATTLAHWTEAVKPYGRALLASVVAIIVVIIVWGYVSTQDRIRDADGWTDYFSAVGSRDEQRLQDVAEAYASTNVGEWAALTLADWDLDNGTNRLLTDRVLAKDQLRDAAEKYSALVLPGIPETIQERATYGLARAHEASGELEKARSEYRSLAEKWPNSPFAAASEARAKELDELPTKQFYDWIAKYEPPKSLSGEPGTPGARPDFLKEPDAGTLQLPSSLDSAAPLPTFPSGLGEESGDDKSEPATGAKDAGESTPEAGVSVEEPTQEPTKPEPSTSSEPEPASGPELK